MNEWKVVLVVEDDTDGRALRLLAEASGLDCRIDWVPANGLGNIKRRGPKLIKLAQDRIDGRDGCVAVLVDRDCHDSIKDDAYRSIRSHCQDARVPYLEAIECFESWCLADAGICRWLAVKQPASTDRLRDAKSRVSRAYFKKTNGLIKSDAPGRN